MPWTEWLLGLAFLGGALFIFVYIYLYEVKKLTNLGANIVMIILVGIAGLCFYEGKIESVVFDRRTGTMILSRRDSTFNKKQTFHVSFACYFSRKEKLVSD